MTFNYKIFYWKTFQIFSIVLLSGILATYYDNLSMLGLIPAFEVIRNILKHSDSLDEFLKELLEE